MDTCGDKDQKLMLVTVNGQANIFNGQDDIFNGEIKNFI
jgi:hypothetical protein